MIHLLIVRFLVGERVTLADIAVGTSVYNLFTMVLDPGFRKAFSHVVRWFTTCVNQPQWLAVLGETTLCIKRAAAKQDKPEKTENQEKQEKPKKVKEPKKPQSESDEDEDEDYKDKVEHVQNPLDAIQSPFKLDEWKRNYSNWKIAEALDWFWKNMDRPNWSIWFCDYKFSSELEPPVFRVSNLVSGWIQRLDKLRKYGFGSVLIFEKEPNKFEISGCWLFKGQEIPAEMRECDDCELYIWRKADIELAKDKTDVEEIWSWSGSFGGGRKFLDEGKVFK